MLYTRIIEGFNNYHKHSSEQFILFTHHAFRLFPKCYTSARKVKIQFPSYRTRSATLPRYEPLPTTTTGHYTICCKNPQSCASEDGQNLPETC